jgi:transcriptional regulator with XRE-family HTH domain
MDSEHYNQIGTLLRKARDERQLQLQQASRLLHIRVRYLEALETGRFSELPGVAYTKGYLQAYAAFLGLDRDEILRRFEQVEDLLGKKGFYLPEVFSKEKKPAQWTIWGGLTVAVITFAFWHIAVRPTVVPVSVVEDFSPERLYSGHITVKPREGACFQALTAYYPPCTTTGTRSAVTPLPRPMVSVMELTLD